MKHFSRDQLQMIFNRIIKKLIDEGIDNISFEEDLYRFIPTDEWGTYEKDTILEGSLFDDIDSLQELAQDSNRYCSYVDFDRIAFVLRAISEKYAPAGE